MTYKPKADHDLYMGMVVRCIDDDTLHTISSKKMWGYCLAPMNMPKDADAEWRMKHGKGFVDVYAIASDYELVSTDGAYCPLNPTRIRP